MASITLPEDMLYRLIRHAGYLSNRCGNGPLIRAEVERCQDAIGEVRDFLIDLDPTVAEDGLWCKIGLTPEPPASKCEWCGRQDASVRVSRVSECVDGCDGIHVLCGPCRQFDVLANAKAMQR